MSDSNVQVGPHEYEPMRRLLNRGRCRACYVHEFAHPVSGWTPSRPLRDKTMPGDTRAILGGRA